MERPYNIAQVNQLCEQLKSIKLEELEQIITNFPDLTKSIIFLTLEFKDQAEEYKKKAIESLKDDYYSDVLAFLNNINLDFFIENNVVNYKNMRLFPSDEVRGIAIQKIAPTLESLDAVNKLQLIEGLLGQTLTAKYSQQFIYDKLPSELVKELQLEIIVNNEKVQMALDYAEEVDLVATAEGQNVIWMLEAKEEKKESDFWKSFKEKVNNFTKNTIGNPTFRKCAAVSLAIGVALIADDASAANALDLNMNDVSDYFNQFGDHFNENTLPKSGFSEKCKVVTETIQNGADSITSKINIGDRQIVIDIKSSAVHGKSGASIAQSGVNMEIFRLPNVKSGCDMDVNDYIRLGKVITKQIASLK